MINESVVLIGTILLYTCSNQVSEVSSYVPFLIGTCSILHLDFPENVGRDGVLVFKERLKIDLPVCLCQGDQH